jgi:hypothetical protein
MILLALFLELAPPSRPPVEGCKWEQLTDKHLGRPAAPSPDEVPDPQCGPFGDAPDGIQYFEVHPGARKALFVRVGQDDPLFDEKTLRLFEPESGK